MSKITVCIPSIPPRSELLKRAIQSVTSQVLPPAAIAISMDINREGAWTTRMRAAQMAQTEWIAFLDDDDELLPNHLSALLAHAEYHSADCVWGWFEVHGGTDPFPHYKGRQYDPAQPHIVPITYLVRKDLFLSSPGFQPDSNGVWDVQDQPVLDYIYRNGKMLAVNDITWRWHHHGKNTSGLPTRW